MAVRVSYAKILSGAATSGAVNCREILPCAIQLPAAFTGTTVTFTGSTLDEGNSGNPFTTYGAIYNSAGQISYAVAANRVVALNPADFAGVRSLKIVSGSNEGADRLIAILYRDE